MINLLKMWEDRCQAIFDKLQSEDDKFYCKSSEPSISIGISNTGNYYCEIYSYVVDYTPDGGRHHYFEAKNIEDLIILVEKAISEQERNVGIKNE